MLPYDPELSTVQEVTTTLSGAACRFQWNDEHLLVAVSGGADSIALLRGLLLLQAQSPCCRELLVAHVNHQLRGDASDQDAAWIANTCELLDVPCRVLQADVAGVAQREGIGVEEAARRERYRLLQALAEERNCQFILVAHTADDQVETVLHHFLRGSSVAGLAGMPERRSLSDSMSLVRPLLTLRRTQLVRFLDALKQDYREDASNLDQSMTRNRLRHLLLPLLREQFNPHVDDAVLRLSQQALEAAAALEAIAGECLQNCTIETSDNLVRLDVRQLRLLPRHLVRECIVQLWKQRAWPRQKMTAAHWDRAAHVLLDGISADFPGGIRITRRRHECEIACRD